MVYRIGYLLLNKSNYASEIVKRTNSIVIAMGILIVLLLMSSSASAETVTYYLNATAGVNIGADGVTTVTGSNQIIPPVIKALMDKTGLNSGGALTNNHPWALYNHSRWYLTSNYPVNTIINSNPTGKVFLSVGSSPNPLRVKLYDYNPLTGSKILIGSNSSITLTGGGANGTYSYTIISPTYIVPLNHRLMLQFEFNQQSHNSFARIYANQSNSYISVVETPITYNVSVEPNPLIASIKAGENFIYSITVNNTGTTDGSYNLGVSDSDTTNFSSSVLGMTSLFVPAGGSNQTTLTITANGSATKDASDITTVIVTSNEDSSYTNLTQITTTVDASSFSNCAQCHASYVIAVENSMHNQTRNSTAPACTTCHINYDTDSGHNGYIVNETNTCRTCHVEGINLSESHGNHGYGQDHADCTQCHFANTTQQLNTSLFAHDHNLTVEYNFYNYNLSGMPLESDHSTSRKGMFPYYTCTLTCHNGLEGGEPKIENQAISWSQSGHAKASSHASKYNGSCLKCHSPPMYNSSNDANLSTSDVQGIQCRVCHNLHNDTYSGNGISPINTAFYNATSSNLAGSPIYDTVATATELCEKCHAGGQHSTTRDIYYGGSHKSSLGFTCANCHMNSTINNGAEHSFRINNTATGKTGCKACHDPASVHSANFRFYSLHENSVTCDACHDDTMVRNSTNYVVNVSTGKVIGSIWKNPSTNKWTTYRGTGTPTDWTFHNITKDVNCDKCHGGLSVKNGTIASPLGEGTRCAQCHATYVNAVNSSMHNQTRNPSAPACTTCHVNYDNNAGHNNFTVNESNTCRNPGCHVQDVNGFYERHSSTSDCTTCHFANTTRVFERNGSLFKHDHNLSIEHSYYEYNQIGGIPVASNGGIGLGMFPYYSCQLPCHGSGYGNVTSRTDLNLDKASRSWLNSSHARSLHMSGDNKNSCAKCKSPTDYNASASSGELIAQEDWDGIQCRVCHNIHKRNQSTIGPIAFYNSTLSSQAGYAVYESVNSTTQLCENCHYGSSHDIKFAGTHKVTAGFNCTNCHMNSSFNNERHKFEVKNTISEVTGCEVCHDQADHTFQFTSNHTGKVTCEACHDKTVARNATGFAVSPDGKSYGLYLDPATSEVSSWKDSHGTPATWPLHNITIDVKCDKCHGTYSIFNGSIKQDFLIVNEISCMNCHIIAQGPADNPFKYPAISASLVTKHKNVDNSTGADVLDGNDCRTCHYDTKNMSKVLTYSCEECHFQGSFNASLIKNHIQDGLRITTNATCSDCHNNSINNYAYSANASVSHYETNISLIDSSDCIVCHNGEYTNNVSWGNPQNISTSAKRSHNETQTSQCDLCHKDRSIPSLELVTFHNVGLQSDIKNCMGCHPTITSLDMGEHSIMSGTNATGNDDCRICHLEEICKLEVGYSNKSNTYYCQDCHTYYGTGPNKSRIIWNERQHGRAECINCHIADGIYHRDNSRGAVANSDYVNRYKNATYNNTLYNNYTDCADCHYAATLDDAPFYGPAGGRHVVNPGIGGNGACVNSCHKSGNTMAKTMHSVATRSIPYKSTITVPVLDQSTVFKGTNVSITATVDFVYDYAFIDGAQYRIMSGMSEIRPWTPMSAVDGDFNGTHEHVTATISTEIPSGTYIVQVRGMAGGPAQNWSILYYPMNGEISLLQNTTLTILAQMGYINGTVSNGSSNISGATIYTTGASYITGPDGKYSLRVPEGTYDVTASKQPIYDDNTSIGIDVTPDNTSTADFVIYLKPIGTITGSVTNT